MKIIDYYESYKNDLGHIYSLDMVRYNFEFAEDCNEKFQKLLASYNMIYGCTIKQFLSKSGLGYHYLYNIAFENNNISCSFAIGVGLNSKSDNKDKGFIEFNPNKCYFLPQFQNFLYEFFELCCELELVRYDVAIDIPLPRSQVKLIRNMRANYEYVIQPLKEGMTIGRSVTEYQGQRNHNKFTKLYDKKAESHLDYDLTRVEFTFDKRETSFENLANFFIYDTKIINEYDFSPLTSSELCLIDLLRNSPDINYYLSNLSYRKRKKLEPYLYDTTLKIDKTLLLKIRDFAISYEFSK